MIKGQIISGEFSKVIAREKAGCKFEIGELLICDGVLMQVYDLFFGSQISQLNLELISGMDLEESEDLEFYDKEIRNYYLARLKSLVNIGDKISLTKKMPSFFAKLRTVEKEDLKFLDKPKNPLFFGKMRSGSSVLDFDINLDGTKVLSHHILVPGTTGRGKSVLVKNMLASITDYAGVLVLDPHDEYYGRNSIGLKDCSNVSYYTMNNVPTGAYSLKINIKNLRPYHLTLMSWSDPQYQAMNAYYKRYGKDWISAVLLEKEIGENFLEGTINVVKRRLMLTLDLSVKDSDVFSTGVFDVNSGETTINDICDSLEDAKIVIIDTSLFPGEVEVLIGSLIANEIFNRYKRFKSLGIKKPVVSIVLEEAPRVIGKDILEKGPNIFSTIAREGRKFNVGLFAITQLPSLIPKEILANMNTKIILGTEMKGERTAIIESASQDLSDDDRNIASLDVGEAIVSSNFFKFAVPIKIPMFGVDILKKKEETVIKRRFEGVGS